jgi:hypothetical protein
MNQNQTLQVDGDLSRKNAPETKSVIDTYWQKKLNNKHSIKFIIQEMNNSQELSKRTIRSSAVYVPEKMHHEIEIKSGDDATPEIRSTIVTPK